MSQQQTIHIIGAGLAGSEAAWQLAKQGFAVNLYEMRPKTMTPAHKTDKCAELVCSNSFRADNLENAVGLLHEEMCQLDSLIMQTGDACKVPAGGAMAVDRELFSSTVTQTLENESLITLIQEEITEIPKDGIVLIASGPLTSDALYQEIQKLTGEEHLSFFDAIAPVVDAEGRLTGMIMVDDIVEVLQEEYTEDMLALAGVNEAGLADTIMETVRSRVPWLAINLGTAILASAVIATFSAVISKIVALAVLAPIVASMGGNAGTQGLAVAVRSIASRDITSSNVRRIVLREISAGLINGLIFAAIMGPIAYLWFHSVLLALVIGAAMLINLLIAGLAGILVPLGLKKLGADPAVASSVFVTTATDVIGFFVFLGLAT
ncbi:MAG: FAD-dependent oxidoreductase, partial [Ghiorsea sp.]|nr:FAD-dependent oxidoreductase [Ghiorsea sp.]